MRPERVSDERAPGEIDSISWANPHIVMVIDASDSQQYRIEWFSLQQLARAGLSAHSLLTGDHVVIKGARHRDPAMNVVTLLTEVRRPQDGWAWSRERARPAECTQ